MRPYVRAELSPDSERGDERLPGRAVRKRAPPRLPPPLLYGALLALAPFALMGLQRTFRKSVPHHFPEEYGGCPSADEAEFTEWVEQLTRAVIRPGNEVEILRDGGETFPRLWSELQEAERSIDFQVYYGESGRVADRTFAILEERARAGVRVRFLYDPVGFRGMDRINHRTHPRIVVMDGRVGYTGDFGISDKWLGDGRSEGSWRSTNARFRGPALREHSAAFATLWAEATGELTAGEGLFAEPVGAAGMRAALLHATPSVGSTAAERVWALTIGGARETCWVTSGYFAPPAGQMQLLCAAARHTDVPAAYWAGRSRYPELLEAGVQLYEYQPSMMHTKSWVVDGVWCSVGALNLDNRSVALNDEVALMVHDEGFGSRLAAIFRDDLTRSGRVTPADLERSGWLERAAAWGADRIAPLL